MTQLTPHLVAEILFWIVFLVWSVIRAIQIGTRPSSHVRSGRLPMVTPWNAFDEKRWTPEEVEYNKRVLAFAGQTAALFLFGRLVIALCF